jgi:hypothetical protein
MKEMKTINRILFFVLTVLMAGACTQNYIDDISKVEPGPDETAPQVTVKFPPEGYELQTNAAIASINIDFEVRDDIEIGSVSVAINGTEIASFNDFLDYRVFKKQYTFDNVTTGSHVLSVTATDLEGKTTTKNVNFSKAPPYVPLYAGEVFYMPFNSEFREMNNLQLATVVGSPSFGDGIQGGKAYQGAADSYLTFPVSILQGSAEVSASFWMKVDNSADRAGILVVAPPADNNNDRTKGFRFFREASNAGATQRFKLNVGNGAADTWVDGGAAADVTPNTGEWVHFAFSVSTTEAVVYINGEVVKQSPFTGIDWTGTGQISIMSGSPNWTGWNHFSDRSMLDELRIFNKALTQNEIRSIMVKEMAVVHMDFNGDFEDVISGNDATAVGSPGFEYGGGISGDAYKGAADSYLSFPADVLKGSPEMSASFWMKVNNSMDRAGILVVTPPSENNNDRTKGFRFFREASNAGATQRFKLNVGNGAADTWVDGGADADVTPNTGEWVHFAFSVSTSEAVVYINGEVAKQGAFTGIDWTGCEQISIMSGSPNWTGWNHFSDGSLLDELYLFNRPLSQEDVQAMMNAEL